MTFNRVPQDFMKGIFMAPHNFNDPQNPKHGEYVNMQLRNDLYFSTLHEISDVQFGFFANNNQQQWIKVEKFKECKGQLTWFGQMAHDYKKKKGRTINTHNDLNIDMISCQEWEVAYHKGEAKEISNYRVHVLQTDSDIFKTEIFPPSIFKTLKDLLIN